MTAPADHLADAGMEAMKTFLILLMGLLNIGAHLFLAIMSFALPSCLMLIGTLSPLMINYCDWGKSILFICMFTSPRALNIPSPLPITSSHSPLTLETDLS